MDRIPAWARLIFAIAVAAACAGWYVQGTVSKVEASLGEAHEHVALALDATEELDKRIKAVEAVNGVVMERVGSIKESLAELKSLIRAIDDRLQAHYQGGK